MVVLVALAAGSVRWATDRPVAPDCPSQLRGRRSDPRRTPRPTVGVVPEHAAATVRVATESGRKRLPQLLHERVGPPAAARRPARTARADHRFPGGAVGGRGGQPSGPELTGPAQPLERLPSPGETPRRAASEMPIAGPSEPADRQTTTPARQTVLPAAEASAYPVWRHGVSGGGFARRLRQAAGCRRCPAGVAWPHDVAADDHGAEPDRSEQLEQVARQADRQTRHGFELAGRGAYFAARSEFIGALRLVAEGLDTEQKTDVHGRALAAALTAMKEAEDFLPGGSRLEADLDLPGIIAAHATPVLKDDAEQRDFA